MDIANMTDAELVELSQKMSAEKARRKGGPVRVAIEFEGYNKYWSKPWIAKVTSWRGGEEPEFGVGKIPR